MIPISKLKTGTKETAFESTPQFVRVTCAIATAVEKSTNTNQESYETFETLTLKL